VLKLRLEEAHHVDTRPGHPRDRDAGVLVGGEHFLDAPAGDLVPRGGAPVPRHHDPVGVPDRDHGGAVRRRLERRGGCPAGRDRQLGVGRHAPKHLYEVRARIAPGPEERQSPLVHVVPRLPGRRPDEFPRARLSKRHELACLRLGTIEIPDRTHESILIVCELP